MTIDFNDTKTQRMIFIVFIGVVAAGLIWYFKINPQTETLRQLKATSFTRQEELNRILILRPQLERMRVDVANLQREMDSLKAIFPLNPDVPGLITNVTRVARGQRIAILNFRPSGSITKEYYVENHYEMAILGSYHNVGKFFAQIANFDLLINIDNMSIRTSSLLLSDLNEFESLRGRGRREADPNQMVRSVQVSFRITTYSSLQGAGN